MALQVFDSVIFDGTIFDTGDMVSNFEPYFASGFVNVVYFVEFQFKSQTTYLSTANFNITWGGNTWLGFGQVGTIGDVQQTEGMETSAVTFTLNIAQLELLALALGDVDEYRGRRAKMYICPLTSDYQMIDTPVLIWTGIMDTMAAAVSGQDGNINLKCESSAYGLKRQQSYRLNAAQWKRYNPTDRGLEYITDLLSNPQKWLTKRFQEI